MQVNRNEEASAAKTNRRRKCGLRIAECGIERRPSARTEEPQTKREEKPTANRREWTRILYLYSRPFVSIRG
jgi:hypothetical protein